MDSLELEAETPEGLEEEFYDKVEDYTENHFGYELDIESYNVESGKHSMKLEADRGPSQTGTAGTAPEFHALDAESEQELEELYAELGGAETRRGSRRSVKVAKSADAEDSGTYYRACIMSKGPWRS